MFLFGCLWVSYSGFAFFLVNFGALVLWDFPKSGIVTP